MSNILLALLYLLLARLSIASPTHKTAHNGFEQALCNTKHPDITPLDRPVISYKASPKRTPQEYLHYQGEVFGQTAARWYQDFSGGHSMPKVVSRPQILPIRSGAPTIISLYYPHPNPPGWKSQDAYLERIQRLADTGEQVVIYVAKSVSSTIKKMRSDKHWHVIDDYETLWDMPNNKFQQDNFEFEQPKLFDAMAKTGTEAWHPSRVYNDGFYSAAYNAKAFVAFDAPLRNPFGSDRWVFMDAGLLVTPSMPGQGAAPTEHGKPWDMLFGGFLDSQKIDRSIKLTQDTGVVFPEYVINPGRELVNINSRAFSDPLYQWQNKFFLGGLFVGNTLGMLNFAVRYMQTVDMLDANGRYTGREEFVTPIVAAAYPNTVFSQPVQQLPQQLHGNFGDSSLKNWKYMLLSYSTPYGKNMLPQMGDPIASRLCGAHTNYRPRGFLAAGQR